MFEFPRDLIQVWLEPLNWKKVLSISYIRGGVYKENKKYPWAEFGKAQVKLNLSRNDKVLLGTVQVSCEQIQPPSK